MIHLDPDDKIYIVDLQTLGADGLDARHDFNPAQLHATAAGLAREPDHRRQQALLDIGRLPSLRGLLESPSISKAVFNSTQTAPALSAALGITLRGLEDIQVVELVGRPLAALLYSPCSDVGRRVGSRSLRCCLE